MLGSMLRRDTIALLSLIVAAPLGGCDGGDDLDAGFDAGPASDAGPPDSGPPEELALSTDAFEDGAAVPTRYLCGPPAPVPMQGDNVTPALSWTAGPAATMSYAVVVRDRSAGDLVHWVLYDIDAATRQIAEGVAPGYMAAAPAGAKQAEIQGSGYFGYFGPCSGGRGNTYEWTLHALDTPTVPGVTMASTENEIAAAIEGASIASASFTGIY